MCSFNCTYLTEGKLSYFPASEIAVKGDGDEEEHDDEVDGPAHDTLCLGTERGVQHGINPAPSVYGESIDPITLIETLLKLCRTSILLIVHMSSDHLPHMKSIRVSAFIEYTNIDSI